MYIAKRQYLDERQVNFVVGGLIEKIITDNKSNLAPHIGLLRGYIGAYSKSQRLSGFPEELRTELKVIESALGTQQLLIVPLIIELRKFLSVSDTIERRARFSTHFGVVLGSVSIVISVLFYVIPLKTDPFEKCDVHNNTSSNQATH
ncbi:hypothetical protein [Pseudomonas yamanorum]|uniref:hypothetical protein n=1 Tax=Pseudomonas yamanorum TaxID=515393 RepID=UPI003BA1C7AF